MKIKKPTLLLNKQKCLSNFRKIFQKAKLNHIKFRPHFKTHQSLIIGRWLRNEGLEAITVSSVSMASYFANDGWSDITIAFPVNINELEEINILAEKISLNILVSDKNVIHSLIAGITNPVGFFIEIDCGYHRSGIDFNEFQLISDILDQTINHPKLSFKGLLTHAGNTYQAKSIDEINAIYKNSVHHLLTIKDRLKEVYPELIISVGDTPSCSVVENFLGIDEMRPGNFIFYDVMQYSIGSCNADQIAVSLACPVVAKYPERKEIIIYGGAIQLSKDFITDRNGTKIFGLISEFTHLNWSLPFDGCYVKNVSQEHGVIQCTSEVFEKFNIGDILAVLPIHSCLTADAMQAFLTIEGEKISMMPKH